MMYGNKLAAAIKVDGKILREFKDTVYIPFGAEYTILVKNLEGRRAVVNVFIDGDNAVPGGLVLNANQEIELERKIVNNNLREGNRFKFIERTENIENGPRGIKLEDGLIRVEHQFEVYVPPISTWNNQPIWRVTDVYPNGLPFSTNVYGATSSEYKGVTDKFSVTASGATAQMNVGGIMRGVDYSKGEAVKAAAATATSATLNSMNISASVGEVHDGMATMDCSFNDVGITVPGSKSTQVFRTAHVGQLEPTTHTMVIKLVGDLGDNKPVTKAVTVKHKVKCTTCGRQNKHNAKFCTECGTALEIFA